MREVRAVQASLHGCPKEASRITCQGIILYFTETSYVTYRSKFVVFLLSHPLVPISSSR
jgi:hypothetical protein